MSQILLKYLFSGLPALRRMLVVFIVAFLLNFPAFAYKKEGHEAIEARAYTLFKLIQAGVGHDDGPTMFKWLQDNDFLSEDGLMHSAYPDLSFERQFAQDRQMFHFMASDKAVMDACLETTTATRQHRILVPSLNECLQMMYFFAKETLDNPAGASQAGRGTYVLMHIVEDSYSTEHATRDADGKELLAIKGWELSKLKWPKEATALYTDCSMLLLHHAFHSPGDDAWEGPTPGTLSPLAEAAAVNVCDLLLNLYLSAHDPDKADQYIADYFNKYFKPFGGIVNGNSYIFAGNNDKVRFDYNREYEAHPKFVTFAYDRSAGLTLMAFGSFGFVHPAYGIEGQWFFLSPRAADDKHVFLQRLPLALGISIAEVNHFGGQQFTDNLLLKTFLKTAIAVPIINKNIEPYFGFSAFPGGHLQRFNSVIGWDLSWNVGKDWGVAGKATASRLAIGYETNFSGYPATQNLVIKFGFNTFGGRVVNKNNKKVINRKI